MPFTSCIAQGISLRQISRQFHVSRHAVRDIIRQQGAVPQRVRKDKIQIDPELLRRLYHACDGWIQRVHEKLVEEEQIQVSYPTLTRILRAMDLGAPAGRAAITCRTNRARRCSTTRPSIG